MSSIFYKTRFVVFSLCAGFVYISSAGAQTAADIANAARQSEEIQRQQQQRLQSDQENLRLSSPPVGGADLQNLHPSPVAPKVGAPCRQIDEIRVLGADHLSRESIIKVTQAYADHCLGVSEIEAILAELTRLYIERGYITTRVYLPAQDLSAGTLLIQVLEGMIEGYRIEGPGAASIYAPGIFPAKPGHVLNLRDLEQGIEQINRLSSNSAQLDIQPGDKPGHSVVVVHNKKTNLAHAQFSVDNQGSESTGNYGAAVSASLDSPLHWNERILFTHRDTWAPNRNGHTSISDGVEFWLPMGYSALTVAVNRSNYQNMIALASGTSLRSEGNTQTTSVGLDRVVFRDQITRTSVSGKLTVQPTKNYLEGQLLTVSSRKLAYLDIGANNLTGFMGGMFNSQLTFSQGIRGFGGLADAANITSDAPHAQFSKVALDLSFNRNYRVFDQSVAWSSALSGQHAFNTLFGSQQMLIGGLGTVRGFVNNTLSGDNGYFWRNELAVPYRLPLEADAAFGRFFVGYDFGDVRSRAAGVSGGRLSGAAIGVSLQLKGVSLELSGSRPLTMPSGMVRESGRTWIRMSCAL